MALLENKKIYFDYEILEKIEAGIELIGTEVKSQLQQLGKQVLLQALCLLHQDGQKNGGCCSMIRVKKLQKQP